MWWHMIWSFQWGESMTTRRPKRCSFYIVMVLLKEIPFWSLFCFLLWFIISQNWRRFTFFRTDRRINCIISTSANARKQFGRYGQQHCIGKIARSDWMWLDVTVQWKEQIVLVKPILLSGENVLAATAELSEDTYILISWYIIH